MCDEGGKTRNSWWPAVLALLAACGPAPSPLDCSLDRAEELLGILEPVDNEAAAEAAAADIAEWVAGWEVHNHRTAGLESVSGAPYARLLETRRLRLEGLRQRLRRQGDRLAAAPYLERFRIHLDAALAILPPASPG